ncbi:MAG TPA: hypothetical protein VK753_03945 [Xanthomonadaceae bacterium]|jgi:uridine kinase|nr:hypothetical protein [Xanthomonadaceae bacterium]
MTIVHTLASRIATSHTTASPPFLVAICGWADTGKSTLAHEVCNALASMGTSADWISTDAFMNDRAERNRLGISGYNPLSIDVAALSDTVRRFVARENVTYHPYDNRTGTKSPVQKTIRPQSVIVVEGIHAFHPSIASAHHLRVFIDADEPTLRAMRLRANIDKRGMDPTQAAKRIDAELEDYRRYIVPMKSRADVSVTVSCDFDYAIKNDGVGNLIATRLHDASALLGSLDARSRDFH